MTRVDILKLSSKWYELHFKSIDSLRYFRNEFLL